MVPLPAFLLILLRRVVLRLLGLAGAGLARREARLRHILAAMGARHRRRSGLERELAKIARLRAALADPGFWEDARSAGLAATVARCANDAGRRAVARRRGLGGARNRGMRGLTGAKPRARRPAAERCSSAMAGPC